MKKSIIVFGQFGEKEDYTKTKAFFCVEALYDTAFNKITLEFDMDLSEADGCVEFKDKEGHSFRLFALKEEIE